MPTSTLVRGRRIIGQRNFRKTSRPTSIVAAALSIHSVEANHAAWAAALSLYAFDPAYSRQKTLKLVVATSFLK
jgi:hypothetical protein